MRTIQRLSCLLAIAVATTFFQTPNAQAQEKKASAIKIGIVDMERIFGEFYKTKDAEDEVEVVKAQIKKEVKQRRAAHEKLFNEAKAIAEKMNDPVLSEALRKKHQAAVKEKDAELRAMDMQMKEYADKRRKQLITQVEDSKAKILNEITKKINDIATADGFDAVFDSSGLSERGFPFVVFVRDATDLSEKVITNLNANAPKKATPTP